jgi:uncharacterized protein YndB with AHSA1/START domain
MNTNSHRVLSPPPLALLAILIAVGVFNPVHCPAGDASMPATSPAAQTYPQIAANGFVVKQQVDIGAPPQRLWTLFVEQVGSWWNPEHTFSGDAKNLSIDARPGGCFCERLPNGGGVEHLRVVQLKPGEMMRFAGALGPLQAAGVTGSLTVKITAGPDGSKVELSYVVGGFMAGGFDKIAPAVDSVLAEQLHRLKNFAETGDPASNRHESPAATAGKSPGT